MKKNRFIPYGYTMRNGKLVIEKSEADVIREIYEQYVRGASLKEIAERLTSEKVPYSEKMTDWGKARVARIIENTKYLGDEMYDKIVDDELFFEAAAVKAARLTSVPGHYNDEIGVIKSRVRCAKCGSTMTRKSSKRFKTTTEWRCSNPECRAKAGISDADLMACITRILYRIKNNESLLRSCSSGNDDGPSELEARFRAELEQGIFDENALMAMIASVATEKYNQISKSELHRTEEIIRKIRRIEATEGFDPGLFDAIVSTVRLGSDEVRIVTRNNIQIGERYGSQVDTEKDGNGDTAEE